MSVFKKYIGNQEAPSAPTPSSQNTAPVTPQAPVATSATAPVARPQATQKPIAEQRPAQQPTSNSQTAASSGRNMLSSDVEIKGHVRFTNDLVVDGKIEGEIDSDGSLTVGENARVRAEIRTRSVVIYGKVHGNIIVSDRVEIKANAELVGDIKAATLSIEAGAIFVGRSTVGAPSTAVTPATQPEKPAESTSQQKQATPSAS